ncbi:sodium/hydrogen exchanger family protein [Peziza echinospora]|nr:sodium/hydrogen exchanger family protein [Peziza echinospora]
MASGTFEGSTSTTAHAATSLPYHEPAILTIVIQSSFLLLLNVINWALNKVLYCGLVGQILVGVAFGIPGADWLGRDAQKTVVQLGYLGLILVVYEGGLSTNITHSLSNLTLSTLVALTGILLPIALSFLLVPLTHPPSTPLQCFSAGAALSATSLGTTFTILSTSGLKGTRLATVLTSAAMMDDVIGLVMIQIVANLGAGSHITAGLIVRPVAVSVGLLVVVVGVCRFAVRPGYGLLQKQVAGSLERKGWWGEVVRMVLAGPYTPFVMHTLLLFGMVSGAAWAGTSALFAAFLAGAVVSWWDQDVVLGAKQEAGSEEVVNESVMSREENQASPPQSPTRKPTTGIEVYEIFYSAPIERILAPLFFASIGFSIPITQMFTGKIIWRGILYAILMIFGKLLTGVWLLRWSSALEKLKLSSSTGRIGGRKSKHDEKDTGTGIQQNSSMPAGNDTRGIVAEGESGSSGSDNEITPSSGVIGSNGAILSPNPNTSAPHLISQCPIPTKSLYPPLILGLAMVARGEIGFLIAAVAQSKGIFSTDSDFNTADSGQDLYIIVIWAIVICTLLGPIAVGLMVGRVKRLEEQHVAAESSGEGEKNSDGEVVGRRRPLNSGVLGSWGVNGSSDEKHS